MTLPTVPLMLLFPDDVAGKATLMESTLSSQFSNSEYREKHNALNQDFNSRQWSIRYGERREILKSNFYHCWILVDLTLKGENLTSSIKSTSSNLLLKFVLTKSLTLLNADKHDLVYKAGDSYRYKSWGLVHHKEPSHRADHCCRGLLHICTGDSGLLSGGCLPYHVLPLYYLLW